MTEGDEDLSQCYYLFLLLPLAACQVLLVMWWWLGGKVIVLKEMVCSVIMASARRHCQIFPLLQCILNAGAMWIKGHSDNMLYCFNLMCSLHGWAQSSWCSVLPCDNFKHKCSTLTKKLTFLTLNPQKNIAFYNSKWICLEVYSLLYSMCWACKHM